MDGGVTSAIQLALTPAFLLTGISSLLNVMTGRLSRIVERGRLLHGSSRHGGHDEFGVELRHLERRLRLTSRAIYAISRLKIPRHKNSPHKTIRCRSPLSRPSQ